MNFPQLFKTATAHPPYPWQERLAQEPICQSRLIDIPTGLGKTAATVLAWIWNRIIQQDPNWPRRLVYCLPMRTLVEQTEQEVFHWLRNLLHACPENPQLRWLTGTENLTPSEIENLRSPDPSSFRSPIILMGGEDLSPAKRDWDLYPEQPAILIGTQDMLLSRALNRGYGMSRYRWPMHFALLNNDCLWIMDEVQLMGAGLASTTQLEGFRDGVTTIGNQICHSWWMSATIRPNWLKTVDMPEALLETQPLQLRDEEKHDADRVEALRTANKSVEKAEAISNSSKNTKVAAEFIASMRSTEGLSLVVVNTVKRARELHAALRKLMKSESNSILLLHSQFRQLDRQRVLEGVLKSPPSKIVVSTQVVEAGVDLSAHTLFTEIAPWSSLIQRFGRCNRWLVNGRQQYDNARIYWFDLVEDKDHPPYPSAAIHEARTRLKSLSNASIQHLEAFESPECDRPEFRHVIRHKDLLDLFDTTPDLAGADLDIDRFIRDAQDSHVRVFWRDWQGGPEKAPDSHENGKYTQEAPKQNELCSVSIGEFRIFLKKNGPAWRWNALDHQWQKVVSENIYPGQIYLLHIDQGGYDQGDVDDSLPTGWNGNPKSKVQPVGFVRVNELLTSEPEAYDGDPASELNRWQTIARHTDEVCQELDGILNSLDYELKNLPGSSDLDIAEVLRLAARWHDWGKAHPAFQAKLEQSKVEKVGLGHSVAKAPESAWIKGRIPSKPTEGEARRPHFRHELASALAILLPDSGFPVIAEVARNLVAYLIAAHHGKVRLSIRSIPNEWHPPKSDDGNERRFARGIWDRDELVGVDLGGGTTANTVTLSLEPMELGLGEQEPFLNQPSWAERCLVLRDHLGPFSLAYLETLLRAADGRASQEPSKNQETTES